MQTYDCHACYVRGNEVEELTKNFKEAYGLLLVRNNVLSAENKIAKLRITELEKDIPWFFDRIAELEAEVTSLNSCVQVRRKQVVKLKAKLDAVEEEVRNIDETFSHPDTTSHEAYRNIRSIVQGLRKTLGEAK